MLRQVLVYVSICSLIGSLSVVSCKALGIALKLTLKGHNQLYSFKTYVFALCVCICVAGADACETAMNWFAVGEVPQRG